MIELEIDGRRVEVAAGATVLEAAEAVDVAIPTLCHWPGVEAAGACMVCVVDDRTSGRLLPACASRAVDGMRITTGGERVIAARRAALDLLLSEHLGECQAPCQLACPAHLDVPHMLRLISAGRWAEAAEVVWQRIALPAVLAAVCPAPCQRACRRGEGDQVLAICALKGVAAREGAAWRPVPDRAPWSGHRVAVVGAGPAGLAAAFHLLRAGHGCTVLDRSAEAGGGLLQAIEEGHLPRPALGADLEVIRRLGVELRQEYDAVVLATGATPVGVAGGLGLATSERGLEVDPATLQSSVPGVFVAGSALRQGRLAVRSVAHGRLAARSVGLLLAGREVAGEPRRFCSRLPAARGARRRQGAVPGDRRVGLEAEAAAIEAGRCLQCACLAADSCRLRQLASDYAADQRRFAAAEKGPVPPRVRRGELVRDPGTCIRCGLCVRLTAESGERPGMAFLGRGLDLRVDAPFGCSLDQALGADAERCAEACPTGALVVDRDYPRAGAEG